MYVNEITFKNSQFNASFLDAIEKDTASSMATSSSSSSSTTNAASSSCWSTKSTSSSSTSASSTTSSVHYLLEVTNLKLFKATISHNIFSGYVISG